MAVLTGCALLWTGRQYISQYLRSSSAVCRGGHYSHIGVSSEWKMLSPSLGLVLTVYP